MPPRRGVKPVLCLRRDVAENKAPRAEAFGRTILLGKGELPTQASVYHLAGACLFALHPF